MTAVLERSAITTLTPDDSPGYLTPSPAVGDWPETGSRPKIDLDLTRYSPVTQRALAQSIERLNQILELDSGWDGRGGQQVALNTAFNAVAFVGLLAGSDAPAAPSIFPLGNGGLQLEWLISGHELEIELHPSGPMHALGVDVDDVVRVDEDLSAENMSGLYRTQQYLREISKALTRR